MQQVATGVEVLLREASEEGDWQSTHSALGQSNRLTLSISELLPWMEVNKPVQALVLGAELQLVFETTLLGVDERHHKLVLQNPDAYTEVNRRRHKRIVTEQPVEWSPLTGVLDHVEHSVATTLDISLGGIRLTAHNPPSPEQEIVLAVLLPIGAATGFAKCLETRSDPDRPDMSISRLEFMWSHPDSQHRLRNWVDTAFGSAARAIKAAQSASRPDLDSLL